MEATMLRWASRAGFIPLVCWTVLTIAHVETARAGETLAPAPDLSDAGLMDYAGTALGKSRQTCGTVESVVRFREQAGQDSVFAACSSGHVFLFHSALKWKPLDASDERQPRFVCRGRRTSKPGSASAEYRIDWESKAVKKPEAESKASAWLVASTARHRCAKTKDRTSAASRRDFTTSRRRYALHFRLRSHRSWLQRHQPSRCHPNHPIHSK
jgi:hypothetical protein